VTHAVHASLPQKGRTFTTGPHPKWGNRPRVCHSTDRRCSSAASDRSSLSGAFSSEVDTGSREESTVLIQSEPIWLWTDARRSTDEFIGFGTKMRCMVCFQQTSHVRSGSICSHQRTSCPYPLFSYVKADIDLQSNRVASKSRDVRRSAYVRFVLQQRTRQRASARSGTKNQHAAFFIG